jgi:hypothetical protein
LALPQTAFKRPVSMVAALLDGGVEDAGGPSVAGSFLGGRSRSHASRADVAIGRAG